MGIRTILSAENISLGTGDVLAGFQTAAAGSAGSNVRVTRVEISQNASITLGAVRGDLATRNTSGTLTLTSTTPVRVNPVGGAASGLAGNTNILGGTARSGTNSSADSGGAYTELVPFNFMNLNGYLWKPDPQEELWIPPSTVFVVRLLASPGTTTGWTVAVWLDEN